MYLFPTEKELNALWRQINPRDRYIAAVSRRNGLKKLKMFT